MKNAKEGLLSHVWLKAAVLGGLWASIEIIIGSFFHNLRLPLAGTILAFNATVLMIAFYQMWPTRGLIWRAGLIAALMKSISPSAIILGPMIGILTEALIIEFFIRIFGNNLLSLTLAGTLSISSSLIQKISKLIIIYGFNDPLQIARNFYLFLVRQLNIENPDPAKLVMIIAAVYLLSGFISALLGRKIGKTSKNQKYTLQGYSLDQTNTNDFMGIDKKQRFSFYLLVFHFTLIPVGLFILNYLSIVYSTVFVVIYSGLVLIHYKRSLRQLKKPAFWGQIILLTLVASIFGITDKPGGPFFSLDGFLIGISMSIRAVFVVLAFAAFGIELRNPVIQNYLFNRGFDKIYSALGLSFTALPVMVEAMPKPGYFLKKPLKSFSDMLLHAKEWLAVFQKQQ